MKSICTLGGFIFFWIVGLFFSPIPKGIYLHRGRDKSKVDTLLLDGAGGFRYGGKTGPYWADGNGYLVLDTLPYPNVLVITSPDTLVGSYAPMQGWWVRTPQNR